MVNIEIQNWRGFHSQPPCENAAEYIYVVFEKYVQFGAISSWILDGENPPNIPLEFWLEVQLRILILEFRAV